MSGTLVDLQGEVRGLRHKVSELEGLLSSHGVFKRLTALEEGVDGINHSLNTKIGRICELESFKEEACKKIRTHWAEINGIKDREGGRCSSYGSIDASQPVIHPDRAQLGFSWIQQLSSWSWEDVQEFNKDFPKIAELWTTWRDNQ